MSESPPTLRNIGRQIASGARRRFTQFVAELGSDSDRSRRRFHQRIEEGVEEEREVDDFNDDYDMLFDEDGDPISLSASTSSTTASISSTRDEVHRQTGINLDKRSPGKEKKEIGFSVAMDKARAIQKRHPKRLLCGGLALRLYNVISREKFSDLDFVTYEWRVVDNEVISMVSTQPYKHCLFLSAEVQEGKTIGGIKLQDLRQILYWKQRYGRDKDKEDLKQYLAKQFLKEEDFNL